MTTRELRVYADPQCPFAWITVNWLWECERLGAARVHLDLLSLWALNEGADLDPEYRALIDESLGTARVCAAMVTGEHADTWPAFYKNYGTRRHVERERDGGMDAMTATVLAELGLDELAPAASDPVWDGELRRRTQTALAGVDGGAPMLHIEGRAFFGPVLTEIPRGDAAVALLDATWTLATTAGFGDIRGVRDSELKTS